ncbi:TIGR02281 family clan AA aspartic protease [Pseudorhodoplanes sp.]|uniref:TIGR02281 family clan AA aspartic protease n=1 Tax=Pseudorhodoplanes sp. TaxID=1934341 RepID=UPI002C50B6B2|nr:TIGR02281 family clan AA aspartic protease [Pseudorhodoplanes sp.]HWV54022.1 TIGR02281 family clan AA aspartic protease [Pseudorhodoplanes sp.]
MRSRILWLLLIGLALAAIVLVARHDAGTVGPLSTDDFASLAVKIALLVFLGSSALVVFRESIGKALQIVLIWVVIGFALALGYTYRFELRDTYDRVMAEMVPGRAATRGRIVEIARGRGGSFDVATRVNGGSVPMVLDTGASAVVLTQEAAKAAGLPLEVLSYSVTVDTANGKTRAAAVTLDSISVGGLVERSVPALIAQPGQLRTSLLGMSFLNRLESWEVRGDRLVLRGYP